MVIPPLVASFTACPLDGPANDTTPVTFNLSSTVRVSPTVRLLPIPTPCSTTKAPVVLFVEFVSDVKVRTPVILEVPSTCSFDVGSFSPIPRFLFLNTNVALSTSTSS